jgi:hypothetical protein
VLVGRGASTSRDAVCKFFVDRWGRRCFDDRRMESLVRVDGSGITGCDRNACCTSDVSRVNNVSSWNHSCQTRALVVFICTMIVHRDDKEDRNSQKRVIIGFRQSGKARS